MAGARPAGAGWPARVWGAVEFRPENQPIGRIERAQALHLSRFGMVSTPGSVDTTNILSVCRTGDAVDEALLKEMLGYFVDENHRRMHQATEAVKDTDREALRQIAHAVRGSAAMLGAGRMHDLATSIEHNALADDVDLLRGAVAALRVEFTAVLTALRARHPEACA